MTQFTLTIEDPKDATLIKKLLSKFSGVTLKRISGYRKSGLDEAIEEVAAGRVTKYNSVDDFFKEMGV